jgi:Molecular chaperone
MGSHTKIGVLDWGGGTLDVSIIENKKGIIRELATGGLYDVGGDMIDRKIAEWCHNEVIKKLSKGIAFEEMPPAARDKMLVACELAKRELSQEELAEIWITNYGDLGRVSIVLDIDTFSDLIRYDIDKAISCFERTLAKARISIEELECIMMVGGSVNLKPFLDKVMKRWDTDIVIPKETDWSVAKGAARLSMRPGSYTVSQTVGVIMSDGTLYPLINAGDKIITEEIKMAEFALVEDCFTANFVFADGNIGDQSSTLGYLDIPTFGFFQEKIILETMVDKNLILQVKGKSQSRSGLTEKIWNYPKLQLDYNLPRITLEVD